MENQIEEPKRTDVFDINEDLYIGQEVWFIIKYMAVKCKIKEISFSGPKGWQYFYENSEELKAERKAAKAMGALQFYYIDEPIGHGLYSNEFYRTAQDAKNYLIELNKQDKTWLEKYKGKSKENLFNYRKNTVRWLLSLHERNGATPEELARYKKELVYPKKVKGKDWFII